CTYLLIPNAHPNAQYPTRDILAVSGFVNDDNDYYFFATSGTLFPRIDEDMDADMNADAGPGIKNIDDDGDTAVDDGGTGDDDEDGTSDEETLDGIDNDDDGLIDEDLKSDITSDGQPGIAGMDDDGDDTVDEGNFKDDDEDGQIEEDPLNALLYIYDSGAKTLTESSPGTAQSTILSSQVTNFQVTSGHTNCTNCPLCVLIELTLTGEDAESVTFSECVYPRNILQKTGKRVR
ncbi:unnamed protein product, partial [marine sediment metagenome]